MPILRHIYDSATGAYHDVEVSQEVYDFYRRDAWAIRRNDKRFYAHEIQFSSLIGGQGDAFENFREFVTDELNPEYIFCVNVPEQALFDALAHLSAFEHILLQALVLDGYSEREYARQMGLPQMTIHNRKVRAFCKVKRYLARYN